MALIPQGRVCRRELVRSTNLLTLRHVRGNREWSLLKVTQVLREGITRMVTQFLLAVTSHLAITIRIRV